MNLKNLSSMHYYLVLGYDFGMDDFKPILIKGFNLQCNAYQWCRDHAKLYDRLLLYCDGNPKPQIEWYKDCFDAVNTK